MPTVDFAGTGLMVADKLERNDVDESGLVESNVVVHEADRKDAEGKHLSKVFETLAEDMLAN